jgi:hypothetical protein
MKEGERDYTTAMSYLLVLAARMEDSQNHQIRIREKPLSGSRAGSFRRARQSSKVLILGQRAKVILAYAGQA